MSGESSASCRAYVLRKNCIEYCKLKSSWIKRGGDTGEWGIGRGGVWRGFVSFFDGESGW